MNKKKLPKEVAYLKSSGFALLDFESTTSLVDFLFREIRGLADCIYSPAPLF